MHVLSESRHGLGPAVRNAHVDSLSKRAAAAAGSMDERFEEFVERMTEALSDGALSKSLLEGRWKSEWQADNPTAGHCCTAAEALYFAMGGKAAGLVAYSASYRDCGGRATHWWLVDRQGRIWDPTRAQYDLGGERTPYERVRVDSDFQVRIAPGGFQGQRKLPPGAADEWGFGMKPGRRAAILLAAMEWRPRE